MLRFTPFLFWLSAVLKPLRTMVLGLGDGTSCFAICQVIERLQIDGTCIGINLPGKTQADLPDAIKEHAFPLYEGILSLRNIQGLADIPWSDVHDQDLLLVDLEQTEEWSTEILDDLVSLLSADGCLVVHGLKQELYTDISHHLHRLLPQAACVSIDMDAGLSVWCKNPNVLADMVNTANGRSNHETLSIFMRLGNGLMAERNLDVLVSQLDEQKAALAEAQQSIKQLEAERAELSTALDLRGRKASQYQALYFDCDSELKKLRCLESETLDAQVERQKKDEALAERDTMFGKLRQSRETHYRETATLTALLEDQRKSAAQEVQALRQQLDDLHMRANALALDNNALLCSTSWKITSPLRRIASKLRGHDYRR